MFSTTSSAGEFPPLSEVDYWLERSAVNLAGACEEYARRMDQRWARWEGARAADPRSPVAILNAATLLRPLGDSGVDDMMKEFAHFFARRSGEPWAIWNPWPEPDLLPHGFDLAFSIPLMVRLPGGPVASPPPALRIVEASDAATIADFERVVVDGYPISELQPLQTGSLVDVRFVGGPLRLWIGYLDDRPVTTALAFADGDVNGIYFVATMPDVRGRRFAAAVTSQAAMACPQMPAVLQASPMGYPVYARLGFSEVAPYHVWVKAR